MEVSNSTVTFMSYNETSPLPMFLSPNFQDMLTSWFAFSIIFSITGSIVSIVLLVVMLLQQPFLPQSILLLFHLVLVEFVLSAFLYPAQNIGTFRLYRGQSVNLDCGVLFTIYVTWIVVGYFNAFSLAGLRFLAVTSTELYDRFTTRKALVYNLVLCWVLSIGISATPQIISHGSVFGKVPPLGDCGSSAEVTAFAVTWMFVGNVCPILGAVAIYVILFIIAQAKSRKLQSAPAPVAASDQPARRTVLSKNGRRMTSPAQRRARFTRVLFISSLFHAVCFLPIPLAIATDPVSLYKNLPLLYWLKNLCLLGYAFNPVNRTNGKPYLPGGAS